MEIQWWHWAAMALPILPNLWSIWHVRNHNFSSDQEKSLWFVLAVFVPVLGGLGYIFFGRRRVLATPKNHIPSM